MAILLAALIGALAGVAGGGLAALASLRASQVAARRPLAEKLRQLAEAHVRATAAGTQSAGAEASYEELEAAWLDLFVHQRILCPSWRLQELGSFLLRVIRERKERKDVEAALELAGQVNDVIARIVGAYSSHLSRWQAKREERQIIDQWLKSDKAKELSMDVRTKLKDQLLG